MSHLNELFRHARVRLGLTRNDIAARAGYVNVTKGIRRWDALEQGHEWFPDERVVERFALVLGIDEADLIQAMSLDFAMLDEPMKPSVTVRLMPAVYTSLSLPPECTTEEAVAIAVDYAVIHKFHVWVRLSRIRGIHVSPDGTHEECYGAMVCSLGRWGQQAMRMAKQVSRIPLECTTNSTQE